MISYKPLLHMLVDKNLKLSTVCKEAGLSLKIVTKINNGENITLETIDKLCNYLNCKIEDIVEIIIDKK
jgi:putative transcriptional regulator